MKIANTISLLLILWVLPGCDYTPPLSDLTEAGNYHEAGEYAKAKKHYEAALERLSSVSLYRPIEYQTRYSYGLMLNEYAKEDHPELIPLAREQLEWVLAYLEKEDEWITTKAMALSTLANTYQQEAGYSEDETRYYQLLEKAFAMYSEAAEELARNQDWHNLAYTYYNLGQTADWYGDLPEAILWLEKAVELDKRYGFTEDLEEDSAYLVKLRSKQEKRLETPSG